MQISNENLEIRSQIFNFLYSKEMEFEKTEGFKEAQYLGRLSRPFGGWRISSQRRNPSTYARRNV